MRRALAGLLVGLALGLGGLPAGAQTPTPTGAPATGTPSNAPMGVISGTVRNGTAGGGVPAVAVQLISVPAAGQISAQTQQTTDGTFRFSAAADATVTYLLRTEYGGVPYLDPAPVLISRVLTSAQRDLTVWETTTERPALRIEETTVALDGVDATQAVVQFRREDRVVNPSDRVYIGDAERRTLRIPAPDGVTLVDEEPTFDAISALEQQAVVTTQPIRPGTTTVVTAVLAGFDARTDSYTLRVTAPLPTAAMVVRGPSSQVRALRPTANAVAAPAVVEGGERWLTARRSGAAREGESMVVTLTGLSVGQPANVLTSRRGAAIALGVAMAVVAGGFLVGTRLRSARRLEAAT